MAIIVMAIVEAAKFLFRAQFHKLQLQSWFKRLNKENKSPSDGENMEVDTAANSRASTNTGISQNQDKLEYYNAFIKRFFEGSTIQIHDRNADKNEPPKPRGVLNKLKSAVTQARLFLSTTIKWVYENVIKLKLLSAISISHHPNFRLPRKLVTPKHPPRLSVIVSFMVSRICHFARVFFLSCLNSVAPG